MTAAKQDGGVQMTVTVTRVLYHGDRGFAIARAKTKDGREVSLKGTLHDVVVGSLLEVCGDLVRDPKWGEQVQVRSCTTTPPSDKNGIAIYLSTAPGVGEVLARRIAEELGDSVWSAVENASPRLAEVRGMTPDKATALAAWYADKKGLREAYVALANWGLDRRQTQNAAEHLSPIARREGTTVEALVRANPWRLAEEVEGIGFRTADELALRLKRDPNCVERARAGACWILEEDAADGHTCAEHGELAARVAQELPILRRLVDDGLVALALARRVVFDDVLDGTRYVYLAGLYAAERDVAGSIAARLLYNDDEEAEDRPPIESEDDDQGGQDE